MNTLAIALGGDRRIIGGPFGSNLTQADYCKQGIPVIRGSNMEGNGRWINGPFVFVSPEKVSRDLEKNVAFPGDIIVTQRGTLGQVSIISDKLSYNRYVISQSQMAISVSEKYANPLFVYYWLRSPQFNDYVFKSIIQVGVPHINLGILRASPFNPPSISKQRTIASILGVLDDKIEVNHRMNEALEAMARAFFKDWFVDFGPTRAKLERSKPYLVPEIWSLFPDQLDDDGRPKAWTMGSLSDVAEVIMGASPPGDSYNTIGYGVALVNGPVEFGDFFVTKTKWTTSPTRMSRAGDLIVCVRGSTTGRHAQADGAFCLGRGVCAIRARDNLQAFVERHVIDRMTELLTKTTGSVFPNLSSDDIKSFHISIPSRSVVQAFCGLVAPLRDRIWANVRENDSLAQTRDLLLPKLMSGEIRLKDAEKTVAEVA